MKRRPRRLLGRRIDNELEHHLEALVAMLESQGMDPDAARREAHRRFGSLDHYRDELEAMGRGGDMDGWGALRGWIARDVGFALRTLSRSPGFAALVIGTLAAGIGATTAIFSLLHGVLLRPLGVAEPDRVVAVWETNPSLNVPSSPTSVPTWLDWRGQAGSFGDVAGWWYRSVTLEDEDRSVELLAVEASGNYLTVLGVQPALGRPLAEADEVPDGRGSVAVISHRLWTSLFGGDPGILGSTLVFDGAPVEVVGVMPRVHVAPDTDADVWLPVGFAADDLTNRGGRILHTVARLAPAASIEQARAEIAGIMTRIASEHPTSARGWTAEVVPLREAVVGPVRRSLLVAFAAVGLLLVIACVNVANLLLARSAGRRGELAIRTALGAGRRRLASQLLTESLVYSLLAGLAGIGVAFGMHRLLLGLEPGVLPRLESVRLDLPVLSFAVALSVLTGVLFGLVPALVGTGGDVAGGVRHAAPGVVYGAQRFRRFLVAGQIALTLVLLTGAGLLSRTLLELGRVDPGFDAEGVVAARIFLDEGRYGSWAESRQYYTELLDRLDEIPGVMGAGVTSALPMDPVAINYDLPFRTEANAGVPTGELPQADFRIVSPGYVESMGIAYLAGRGVTPTDDFEAPLVVVVNRTMAERHWPGSNPVGTRIESIGPRGWGWFDVVGVVEDTRFYGLAREPVPEMYVSYRQIATGAMTVAARTRGPRAHFLGELERAVLGIDPVQPPHQVFSVEDLIDDSIASERFYAAVLGLFGVTALALAAGGLYGLLSYQVSQRRRELGLRLAMGATRREIVGLVVSGGLGTTAVGLALGLGVSISASRLLEHMLFGVGVADPVTLGVVSVVFAGCALLACLVPARRASRLDPTASLRDT